jgi:hypothetical protein
MDFLEQCPKRFLIERYSRVILEKHEALEEVRRLRAELALIKKQLDLLQSPRSDDLDSIEQPNTDELPSPNKIQVVSESEDAKSICAICMEDLSLEKMPRAIATLVCRHQFHFDCIALAFSAKGKMQCPCCRQTEGNDSSWDFTIKSSSMEKADEREQVRRMAEDRYLYLENLEDQRERTLSIIEELSKRTLGVVMHNESQQQQTNTSANVNRNNLEEADDGDDDDDVELAAERRRTARARGHVRRSAPTPIRNRPSGNQSQTSTPIAGVLVPVPAVPVDSLEEMRACTIGVKSAIYMPYAFSSDSYYVDEKYEGQE